MNVVWEDMTGEQLVGTAGWSLHYVQLVGTVGWSLHLTLQMDYLELWAQNLNTNNFTVIANLRKLYTLSF